MIRESRVARICILTTALALVAVACGSSHSSAKKQSSASTTVAGPTTSTTMPPPSTEEQERGMKSGQPFQDPPDANASTSNNVKITLNVDQAQVDVAGKKVWAATYNKTYVGPTLRFAAGKTVNIDLFNHMNEPTNIHFHGTHVSPSGNSDDQFLCIAPGKSFRYKLDFPANTPSGTLFYHSHSMATNCPHSGAPDMDMPEMGAADVENQMFAGLSGAIVVGDDRAYLPPEYRNITTHTLVLKDIQIDATGHVVQNAGNTFINPMNPGVRLVSGMLRPVISMRPGETQLWRFVNAGADMAYAAEMAGYTFTIVNIDGQPQVHATFQASLSIPPGRRYDVLVTARDTESTATLQTAALSTGPAGFQWPTAPLATVRVAGEPAKPIPAITEAMPGAQGDLTNAKIATRRTLTLSENNNGMFINGKMFNYAQSIFDQPAVLGTVEEWTIINTTGEMHPFHLHVSSFQLMSINGEPQQYNGAQDVEWVPHTQKNGAPGQIVIRVPFTDFTGRYMFHCHIAGHEDAGMMSFINVVAPKS